MERARPLSSGMAKAACIGLGLACALVGLNLAAGGVAGGSAATDLMLHRSSVGPSGDSLAMPASRNALAQAVLSPTGPGDDGRPAPAVLTRHHDSSKGAGSGVAGLVEGAGVGATENSGAATSEERVRHVEATSTGTPTSGIGHVDDDPPLRGAAANLGTKTPYRPQGDASGYASPPPSAVCRPVHLYAVVRHGTRNPTDDSVAALRSLESVAAEIAKRRAGAGGQSVAGLDLAWLASWASPFGPRGSGQLVPRGERELYLLGRRLRAAYPQLVPARYDAGSVDVSATTVRRTAASAAALAFGLFESRGGLGAAGYQPVAVTSASNAADRELRFFDNCPAFLEQVVRNASSQHRTQGAAFRRGPVYARVAARVRARLGLGLGGAEPFAVLSTADLHAAFTACKFEASVQGVTDRWCALFTAEEVDELLFADDLDAYWGYGPGAPRVARDMACGLLSSAVDGMDRAVARRATHREPQGGEAGDQLPVVPRHGPEAAAEAAAGATVRLRVAHAETVMPLLALLGLYGGDDAAAMTAHASNATRAARVWRTTRVCPFGANVALSLHECVPSSARTTPASHMVRLTVNEREVPVPGCDARAGAGSSSSSSSSGHGAHAAYCPLERFKQLYAHALGPNCDFEARCSTRAAATAA